MNSEEMSYSNDVRRAAERLAELEDLCYDLRKCMRGSLTTEAYQNCIAQALENCPSIRASIVSQLEEESLRVRDVARTHMQAVLARDPTKNK